MTCTFPSAPAGPTNARLSYYKRRWTESEEAEAMRTAGGKVVGIASGGKMSGSLEQQLQDRWLRACDEKTRRPKRLVGLREIVENL